MAVIIDNDAIRFLEEFRTICSRPSVGLKTAGHNIVAIKLLSKDLKKQ